MRLLLSTNAAFSVAGSTANCGGDIAVANALADGSITNITNTTLSVRASALSTATKTTTVFFNN